MLTHSTVVVAGLQLLETAANCALLPLVLQAAERQQEMGRKAQAGVVQAHRRASRQAELQDALTALRAISGEVDGMHRSIEGMQEQLVHLA